MVGVAVVGRRGEKRMSGRESSYPAHVPSPGRAVGIIVLIVIDHGHDASSMPVPTCFDRYTSPSNQTLTHPLGLATSITAPRYHTSVSGIAPLVRGRHAHHDSLTLIGDAVTDFGIQSIRRYTLLQKQMEAFSVHRFHTSTHSNETTATKCQLSSM